MAVLAAKLIVALPLQCNVQPGKPTKMIVAGTEPRRNGLQHVAGLDLLSHIDRQIEAIRREPLAERGQVVLRQSPLPLVGARMENANSICSSTQSSPSRNDLAAADARR